MARFFAQTLLRGTETLIRDQSPASPLLAVRPRLPRSRLINFRARSGRPEKFVQIFGVELDPAADGGASPYAAARGEVAARWLENVIHRVLVRCAAPDWLPFVPGASYWVPPRRRTEGLAELLVRVANPMSEEQVMSLTTMRGWPCTTHFLRDVSPDPLDESTKEAGITSEDDEV